MLVYIYEEFPDLGKRCRVASLDRPAWMVRAFVSLLAKRTGKALSFIQI